MRGGGGGGGTAEAALGELVLGSSHIGVFRRTGGGLPAMQKVEKHASVFGGAIGSRTIV